MAETWIADRGDQHKQRWRVMAKDQHGTRPVTGWCKTLAYAEARKAEQVAEGADDRGVLTEQSGQLFADDVLRTRQGHPLDEVASTMQKALRRGDEVLAGQAAFELCRSGFHRYVWRRLLVCAVEDVGLASPETVTLVGSLRNSYEWYRESRSGGRRGGVDQFLGCAVLALARAPKSREVDDFTWLLDGYAREFEVPDWARDQHTRAGRAMGRGHEFWLTEGRLLAGETGENRYAARADAMFAEQERAKREGKQ